MKILVTIILIGYSCVLSAQTTDRNMPASEKTSAGADNVPILRDQISMNPRNAKLWRSFYDFERDRVVTPYNKVVDKSTQAKLDSILLEMSKHAGNSFEFNYLSYVNSNYDVNAFHFLEKAYKLDPANPEIYDEMVAHYTVVGNGAKRKEFCKKIADSKKYSANTLEYAYNTLQSVSKNGVLITNGEVDTYPLFVQQEVFGVRTDVIVINLDLLRTSGYRNTLKSSHNLIVSGSGELEMINTISNRRTTFLSLTVKPALLRSLKDNLYLTGLAFRYSSSGFNNLPAMADNWSLFKKAELTGNTSGYDRGLNRNYLPVLMQLYNAESDEKVRNEYRQMAEKIGRVSGVWNKVETNFQ